MLRHHSCSPKVNDNYNPATWMLEVNSASMESELGLDFAELHKESLCTWRHLSGPPPRSRDQQFSTE
ncbi:hypothetical protein POPTR_008G099201v4 [Populus trichocarpa]|uniref:Uncharacterized protein n=1 Tax=Populus trichocarpa TaxID=3694 RepID=A0ACC0SKT4_POPTR|nr:hypothetical protein BDE02_08G087900 [Populus trichocarpa]KAI9389835.1 hypothetical protein POPTR_008G099201v4 [Populus trichocarpa]